MQTAEHEYAHERLTTLPAPSRNTKYTIILDQNEKKNISQKEAP
jgi:hypothetical protein